MDARKCNICGKLFIPTGANHVYCGKECKKIASKTPRPEKRKRETVNSELVRVAAEARKAGMSYGQYVGQLYAKEHPVRRREFT